MSANPPTANESPSALYVQAMEQARRYIQGVRSGQWSGPTPCSEWDVRQVVNHLVGENLWAEELFHGRNIAEVGDRLEGDLVDDDPAAAYARSVEVVRAAVQAPGAMEATCHLSFGDFPGSEYARQLFLDTLVHGWDVAKATGQDTALDPRLVAAAYPIAENMAPAGRGAGASAPSRGMGCPHLFPSLFCRENHETRSWG